MKKQVFCVFLWLAVTLSCLSASANEIPKECTPGTPEYNETSCGETCTKEIHITESYCSNFTNKMSTTSRPQPQLTQKEEKTSPSLPDTIPVATEIPENVDFKSNFQSSGVSLSFSHFLVFSFLLYVLVEFY